MEIEKKIVILTGAGISAESGLGTFRDADGLWTKYPLEEVATPEGFARNPLKVHDFYNARRDNLATATPNAAHHALARLMGVARFSTTIVTQNVDTLHEQSGTPVIHMHGQLDQMLCNGCGHRWAAPKATQPDDPCPACSAPLTRPDVVWFGEIPYHMERIAGLLAEADIFAAIGTSGEVYPAAGFVQEARRNGAQCVELNLETGTSPLFHSALEGAATEVVPDWVASLID